MFDALKKSSLLRLAGAVLCTLVLLAACSMFGGGEAPVRHAEGVSVTAPTTWKTHERGESDQAYQLPSGNLVTFTSSCASPGTASLETLTKHLLFGTRNVKYLRREPLNVGDLSGLRSSVRATLDGKPIFLEVAVARTQNCVFDFSLMSQKEIAATELAEFTTFVRSLRHGKN